MNCCDANGACRQGHGCAARTDDTTAPACQAAAARQPGGYPWDAITPTGSTALDDEIENDLSDGLLGLLMTLLLVTALSFCAGFVFARLFG